MGRLAPRLLTLPSWVGSNCGRQSLSAAALVRPGVDAAATHRAVQRPLLAGALAAFLADPAEVPDAAAAELVATSFHRVMASCVLRLCHRPSPPWPLTARTRALLAGWWTRRCA